MTWNTIQTCTLLGFRRSWEFCGADFSSVSASIGVAEETADTGVALPVALSASEGGRRFVSVELCLPA